MFQPWQRKFLSVQSKTERGVRFRLAEMAVWKGFSIWISAGIVGRVKFAAAKMVAGAQAVVSVQADRLQAAMAVVVAAGIVTREGMPDYGVHRSGGRPNSNWVPISVQWTKSCWKLWVQWWS
ncbi:hypothetical protein RchiOBHm_Chr2g0140081 [Rosa chinensis]|uniref:Uncharacterized protein n=1 Tax=Rosa chinensis TaxID=74649 RepID=A0A2P6RXC3_ROSCH|nr:hypothetical protein RchiOBHm_Chr2g0140081 [Rosa chinensis]